MVATVWPSGPLKTALRRDREAEPPAIWSPERAVTRAVPAPARRFQFELLPAAAIPSLAEDWRQLAARALEPNAYHDIGFVTAALNQLNNLDGYRVAAVFDVTSEPRRLVAVLPHRIERLRFPWPIRAITGLSHNYGPLGTPLVEATDAAGTLAALLGWLRTGPLRGSVLLMPHLVENGPAAQALADALTNAGLALAPIDRHRRALHRTVAGVVKRKELSRQRRRLEEQGSVTHTVATVPVDVARDVEDFLNLERSGWKGRAGSATLQRTDRARFLRRALIDMADDGQAMVHCLRLDGRPIAAGLVFRSQSRAWFWKIAYDEAYARFSPGVQLTMLVTEALNGTPGVDSIDSTADADHPMIDRLWSDRLDIADWLIDLRPRRRWLLPVAARFETLRRGGRAIVVRTLKRLLRRG